MKKMKKAVKAVKALKAKKALIFKLTINFFLLVVLFIILALLIFSNVRKTVQLNQLSSELREKEQKLAEMEAKLNELKLSIDKLKTESKQLEAFFQNLTREKEKEKVNISFAELKTFLKLDGTNFLIYDKESFDCTGFALTLWKNARLLGINVGIVEIEFENESIGHMLNAFQTDRGIVYIDATGDENGSGFDKIAYIEKGKPYGVIAIEKASEEIPDCKLDCESLIDGIKYIKHNILSYGYFSAFSECIELYDKCIKFYNEEAKKFNEGKSAYSYEQLRQLYSSILELENSISLDKTIALSKGSVVKKVNVYW
ncbi:MAG: hypothetical protein QXE64_01215 [Candidatus Pacearchaeota archaeon]